MTGTTSRRWRGNDGAFNLICTQAWEAKSLVLERVVGDARATDAHMWVCFGGKERTTAAFEGLLGDAGFVTRSISPLDGDALVAIESKEDK